MPSISSPWLRLPLCQIYFLSIVYLVNAIDLSITTMLVYDNYLAQPSLRVSYSLSGPISMSSSYRLNLKFWGSRIFSHLLRSIVCQYNEGCYPLCLHNFQYGRLSLCLTKLSFYFPAQFVIFTIEPNLHLLYIMIFFGLYHISCSIAWFTQL